MTSKSVEQKVGPLLQNFEMVLNIDRDNVDLTKVKDDVQTLSEVNQVLSVLERGGKDERDSASKLREKMALLVTWGCNLHKGVSGAADFDSTLQQVSEQVSKCFRFADDATSKQVTESFEPALLPLPDCVGQVFALQCCLAFFDENDRPFFCVLKQ